MSKNIAGSEWIPNYIQQGSGSGTTRYVGSVGNVLPVSDPQDGF